jgi:hypothetical protein
MPESARRLPHRDDRGDGQHHRRCIFHTVHGLDISDRAIELQIQRYEHMLLAGFAAALHRIGTTGAPGIEHRANILLALAMSINLHARNRDAAAVDATTASAHALHVDQCAEHHDAQQHRRNSGGETEHEGDAADDLDDRDQQRGETRNRDSPHGEHLLHHRDAGVELVDAVPDEQTTEDHPQDERSGGATAIES